MTSVSASWQHADFLQESDFTAEQLAYLIDLAGQLKIERAAGTEQQRLVGRNVALILEKTSTRTRISFEVACRDQGAGITVLDPASSQIGHKESAADSARVLASIFDAIAYRGALQSVVAELAEYSKVPVYNALTDDWHPTQMLADFMTMVEHAGEERISYAYVGDARSNMGNSMLMMGAIMGSDVRIVAPRELWPSQEIRDAAALRAADSGATITITDDPSEGMPGARFVHTDVWVSMGEPDDVWATRIEQLTPYRIDAKFLELTERPDVQFMHCLPAYHDTKTKIGQLVAEKFGLTDGVEVTHEVFESPASIVFEQAENRMHTIKALMVATLS